MSSIIIIDNERQESRLNDCKSATSIDKTQVVEAVQQKNLKKGQNWKPEIAFKWQVGARLRNFKHVTSQLNAAWQAQRSRKQRVSKYLPSFPFNFYTWDNLFADKFAFLFRQQKLLSRIPRRTKAQQNFHFPLESSRLAL